MRILDDSGVALLLVVTVISLLVALTLQFNRDMRLELSGSVNLLTNSRLHAISLSGYDIAKATLLQDLQKGKSDSFFDIWAELDASSLEQFYPAPTLDLKITDLGGRIPLNNLAVASKKEATTNVLRRLLLSGDLGDIDTERADLIVAAITDWVDKDDDISGDFEETESSYYLSLSPSYGCKNGPLEFVEELLLIRGITEELYFGGEAGAGLRRFVSVTGQDEKININTAPREVLKALIDTGNEDFSDELAENMVTFRDEEENSDLLEDSSWYKTIIGDDVTFEKDLVTTQSGYFRILSRAEINGIVKNMYSVVQRKDDTITLVSRKVE